MRALLRAINHQLDARFGLRVTRRQKPRALTSYDKTGKFNVGAGADIKADHVNCDTRPLPGVAIVCRAWELASFTQEASLVYSRHTLEHLTLAEARHTLKNWFSALKVGGSVHIIVPNLEFHVLQWQRAVWTLDELAKPRSDARYSLAGFYGWQCECDPRDPASYNQSYWDTHKCGYNPALLRLLIEEAGFTDVETWVEGEVHLHARGAKTVADRERQVAPSSSGIRADHVARYRHAAEILASLPDVRELADAACGVGYGSQLLAQNSAWTITALDRDEGALAYARRYYSAPNVRYLSADLAKPLVLPGPVDAVVSFETIEHLHDAPGFLQTIKKVLRPQGSLICSTPNEKTNPFDPARFPFHVRHYTQSELVSLLDAAGFDVVAIWHQARQGDGAISPDKIGDFLIVHATARA